MLPEEFPMVLAVFMAMVTWRISKVQVLTERVWTPPWMQAESWARSGI